MANINGKDTTAIGIHHIGMHSHHFDETIRFYEEGLGFTVKHTWGKGERVAMMDAGCGSCIEVFDAGEGETVSGGSWIHVALHTEDIHASYERAIRAGGKPKLAPAFADILEATPEPVYMWFAYVVGFDGEEIEFIQEVEKPEGSGKCVS